MGKISWRAAQDPTDTETAGGLRKAHESPERNLMLAVLEDAARRYLKYPPKDRLPEETWFASPAQEPLFSFRSICSTLGISAEWFLKRLTSGAVPDVHGYRTMFSPNLGNGLNYRQMSPLGRYDRRAVWRRHRKSLPTLRQVL